MRAPKNYVNINCKIEKEITDKLEEIKNSTGLSKTKIIEDAIDLYYKQHEKSKSHQNGLFEITYPDYFRIEDSFRKYLSVYFSKETEYNKDTIYVVFETFMQTWSNKAGGGYNGGFAPSALKYEYTTIAKAEISSTVTVYGVFFDNNIGYFVNTTNNKKADKFLTDISAHAVCGTMFAKDKYHAVIVNERENAFKTDKAAKIIETVEKHLKTKNEAEYVLYDNIYSIINGD
jgi:hypothetical protein